MLWHFGDDLLAAARNRDSRDPDNGKVFTGRFGPAGSSAEVMFDRICAENGIRHLLTAPRSPTTTGKVERWHKTMRSEFIRLHDRQHATLAELQAALDGWVVTRGPSKEEEGSNLKQLE